VGESTAYTDLTTQPIAAVGVMMSVLGNFLLRASILIAAGWIWLNYWTRWAFHSSSHTFAQAGIIVLIGIALRLLAAGEKI
jgi:hypothetical protein